MVHIYKINTDEEFEKIQKILLKRNYKWKFGDSSFRKKNYTNFIVVEEKRKFLYADIEKFGVTQHYIKNLKEIFQDEVCEKSIKELLNPQLELF